MMLVDMPYDWPLRHASQFKVVDNVRWHFQLLGEGPVVLLLHGTGASAHSLADLAVILSNNFTCLLVDLPGHAFTSPLDERRQLLSSMAVAMYKLCNTLDIAPSYIIGHSAGAAVAIRMCLDTDVSPQALLSVNGALLPFGAFIEPVMLKTARLLSRSRSVTNFLARRGSGTADVRRALRDTGAKISEPMIARYSFLISQTTHIEGTLRMMGGWELGQLAKDLPRLAIPIHLIGCDKDHIVPATRAHRVKRLIPGATAETLKNAGHLVHEAAPERIFQIFTQLATKYN